MGNTVQPQPNTNIPSKAIGIFDVVATFSTSISTNYIRNTLRTRNVIIEKYATGKYKIHSTDGIQVFPQGLTIIHPIISDWASIPLSKTTIGDYSYHYNWISAYQIDIYCQKTSDISYADFKDIFDGLKLPIRIEALYQYDI